MLIRNSIYFKQSINNVTIRGTRNRTSYTLLVENIEHNVYKL